MLQFLTDGRYDPDDRPVHHVSPAARDVLCLG